MRFQQGSILGLR